MQRLIYKFFNSENLGSDKKAYFSTINKTI
ncbi:hypothetical protein ACVW0P_003672 [Mucilaginibacter sp. UYNi724]